MKRFEIAEKLYSSKALLKMAGGRWGVGAFPLFPLDPLLAASATWANYSLAEIGRFSLRLR